VNRALLPIFLIVAVDVLGMTLIMPLLPFYAEHLGASPTQVGLIISTFALCQLFGGPVLGRASDQVGRKPLLILSQVGTLIGFIILAYANQLWLVFLSRVIDGFTAGNLSLAQAYIADITKPEERAKSFAVIGIAFGIGFLVGPGVSGFLVQFGYQWPIWMAAVLSGTSIVATMVLLPRTKPSADAREAGRRLSILAWGGYADYFRRPGLRTLLIQFFVFLFAFSVFMSGFPLFAERRFTWDGEPFHAKHVGYVYAYVGVLSIILQGGLIGRLVRALGEWRLAQAGFALAAIGFGILAFTFDIPMLLIVAAITSVGTGVLRPVLTSLITQQTSRSEQGAVLGLTQSLQAVASIVAPLLAGLLIEHGNLESWALLAAVFSGIGLLMPNPK
jgi:MFS transporter, DHA1 family, tetracycline resistance protein